MKHSDGTYASTLKDFMYHTDFPARKRAEITRVKLRVVGVDTNEGVNLQDIHVTEEDDIEEDDMFDDAIEATISQSSSIGSNKNVGLSDYYFNLLPSRIPENFDWSIDFSDTLTNWLTDFSIKYYKEKNEQILNTDGNSSQLNLINKDLYKPENCKGNSQTFIIYHHLLYQYRLYQ